MTTTPEQNKRHYQAYKKRRDEAFERGSHAAYIGWWNATWTERWELKGGHYYPKDGRHGKA